VRHIFEWSRRNPSWILPNIIEDFFLSNSSRSSILWQFVMMTFFNTSQVFAESLAGAKAVAPTLAHEPTSVDGSRIGYVRALLEGGMR
jgi:hypothetical protein